MKISQALIYIKEQLSGIYDDGEAANIASMLAEHISCITKTDLLLKKDEALSKEDLIQLEQDIARLKNHEPIQYIMKKSWFYGMELYVDRDVLIPRPETEELVDWVIKDLRASNKNAFEKKRGEADETTQLKIIDVGTGSGCIAIALKKNIPKAEVWACDISDSALNIARRNGSELDIRVDFQSVDFLDHDQQKHLPTVDIIVSNPPYVPGRDKKDMSANVLEYEPHTALFVDDNDPLVFYKALAHFSKHRLYQNGCIYMEIHEDLADKVSNIFSDEGYGNIEIRKDMQGKERMVKVKKS